MKFSKAIEGYKLSCLTEGYSPNTMEGYEWAFKRIETFLSDPMIEEITPEDIRRFFYHLNTETKLSSSSIQSIWRSMRSFFNWASRELGIFFQKFGDTTRSVRVRWWIDSYTKENPVLDKVNAALETALGQAGIDMPFDTYNLNVKMQDEKPVPDTQDDDQDNQDDSS